MPVRDHDQLKGLARNIGDPRRARVLVLEIPSEDSHIDGRGFPERGSP